MVARPLTISLLAFSFIFSSEVAFSANGIVDDRGKFPFVVQLSIAYPTGVSFCSAVVAAGGLMVGTAAHCVIPLMGARPNKITIWYEDAMGRTQTVLARRWFFPDRYPQLHDAAYGKDGGRTNNNGVEVRAQAKFDVAIIIPERRIMTLGYVDWITDLIVRDDKDAGIMRDFLSLIQGNADPQQRKNFSLNLAQKKIVSAQVLETFGDLRNTQAMIVGFGAFDCPQAASGKCELDGRRRYAETKITSLLGVNDSDAPWIWETGASSGSATPMRKGDSGGAMLIRALDGRWFFVGYNSAGNDYNYSISSSLLSNLGVFAQARADFLELPTTDYEQQNGNPAALDGGVWARAQARIFASDIVTAWSLPNPGALLRLKGLYASYLESYNQAHYRPIPFEGVYADKKAFFRKWPVREFKIDYRRPLDVSCDIRWKQVVCHLDFDVLWNYESPQTGERASGASRYKFQVQLGGLTGTDFDEIETPKIAAEVGEVIQSAYENDPYTKRGPLNGMCDHPYGDFAVRDAIDYSNRHFLEPDVQLLAEPNKSAAAVGSAPANGIGLSKEVCAADYCLVTYGCFSGWMPASKLAKEDALCHRVVGVRSSDPEGLIIRDRPGKLGQIKGSIPFDATTVIVHGCDDGWCLVSYKQKFGWVSKKFLAKN
jgi:hypothetical protein